MVCGVLAQAVVDKPDRLNPPPAQPPAAEAPAAGAAAGPESPTIKLNIREYRVIGAKKLGAAEIGEAVYPFLGPLRTDKDVEGARDALQALYHEKGFQTVTVEIPEQTGRRGIVFLKVSENKVGRLRVKGSRYFSLSEIKKRAPSLAEGTLPNFKDIERDILALNQLSDRRITPNLRAGVEPGTVDIDLEVKDSFPLHGSLELNNRYSPDTTQLRVNGSISYGNLWQAGHSAGFSFQVAPERLDDARVYSAYYTARFAAVPWLSLTLLGTKQDSDVSTLGGTTSIGRGDIIGGRAEVALPGREGFYHSLTFGLDYKHFKDQQIFAFLEPLPIEYYPWSIAYSGTWAAGKRVTELNATAVFHFRGMGSDQEDFDRKRFGADGSFFYLRGDLSHTQPLPGGFQLYGKVQGQASGRPLLPSEQFSGGGLESVRGYLESTVVGDNALIGTLEFRSPSLTQWFNFKRSSKKAENPANPASPENAASKEDKEDKDNEWRIYLFLDAGLLTINQPLPEQTSRFELASYGIGSQIRLFDHFHGSVDAGVPVIAEGTTSVNEVLLTFRVWGDF
jgi:hemolysin activation/secretion protein